MAKILVVDDESNMRELMADILERDGHEVEGAETGEMAVGLVFDRRYDVVVLDLMLPGIDGIETLKKIKKVRQKYVRYLATCGIRAMMDFIKQGKVEDIDFLLELITDRVNDAIDLLREDREGEETAFEPISLQYTIDRYNKLHATGKSAG